MRYHIGKNGKPTICKAEKGACPLGGDHFDTKEAAQKAADKLNEEKYGYDVAPVINDSMLSEQEHALLTQYMNINDREAMEKAAYNARENRAQSFNILKINKSVPFADKEAFVIQTEEDKEKYMQDDPRTESDRATAKLLLKNIKEGNPITDYEREFFSKAGYSENEITELAQKPPLKALVELRKKLPKYDKVYSKERVSIDYDTKVARKLDEILKRPGLVTDSIDSDNTLSDEEKLKAHQQKIISSLKENDFKKARSVNKAIYMVDGVMISGEFENGVRNLDHNSLRSRFNMSFEELAKYGSIIVPETKTYLGVHSDKLEKAGFTHTE